MHGTVEARRCSVPCTTWREAGGRRHAARVAFVPQARLRRTHAVARLRARTASGHRLDPRHARKRSDSREEINAGAVSTGAGVRPIRLRVVGPAGRGLAPNAGLVELAETAHDLALVELV